MTPMLNPQLLRMVKTHYISDHGSLPRILRGMLANYGLGDVVAGYSPEVALRLYAVGFDPEEIAEILPERGLSTIRAVPLMGNVGVREVMDLHTQGLTAAAIAWQLGMNRGLVYYYLNRLNLRPNRVNSRELTHREVLLLRREHAQGRSAADLARRHNVTYDQVRYALKEGRE